MDKEQRKEYQKNYREKNKEKLREQKKEKYERNKEKILEQRKKYYEENKDLKKEYQKNYREKNKDQIREKDRLRYKKNLMRIKMWKQVNYEKNKKINQKYARRNRKKYKKLNESKHDFEIFDGTMKKCSCCKQENPRYRKYWMRNSCKFDGIGSVCKQCRGKKQIERKKTDPSYKLRCDVGSAIWAAIRRNKGFKNGSSILKKLPYTMQQLRDHLESLWEPWMSWDNYGPVDLMRDTWQIDHKIPQSLLPYDSMDHPNFLICWDLSNLQPMKSIDNIHKGNKIIQGEIK